MSAFDVLSSGWFGERLQDYAFFETNLVHEGIKEVFRKAGKNMDLSVVDGMYQKLMSEAAML